MTRAQDIATGLLLLACAGCGGSVADQPVDRTNPQAAPRALERLRPLDERSIVWYNVENLFDTIDDPRTNDADMLPNGRLRWNSGRYRHKLRQLAQAIHWAAGEAPPILGVAEVENRAVLEDLVHTAPLNGAGYEVVHHDSPDERGIDVGILVRKAYAEVMTSEALTVVLPSGDRTRDVLHAELALADGERMHVFAAHWPSRREGEQESAPKRMAAARVIRTAVDAILAADPRALVLIMGDLNDGPLDASIQQGLRAGCAVGDGDLVAIMCSDRIRGRGSYNHQGRWEFLDQFVVSRSLAERIGVARVFMDDRLLFRHPRYGPSPDRTYAGDDHKGGFSDHLPIVLKLDR